LYANAAISRKVDGLKDIYLPSKNIAIYQRFIDSLDGERIEIALQTISCCASGSAWEIAKTIKITSLDMPLLPNAVKERVNTFGSQPHCTPQRHD
jgi:hypothetical protein